MSNRGLIAGVLVLGYLYIKANGGLPTSTKTVYKGQPATVPATVGSGWQQVATGALAGLLQGIASAPRNNTPNTVVPYDGDYINRGSYLQEAVIDMPTTIDDYLGGNDWGYA